MGMDLTIVIKAVNEASAALGQIKSQIEQLQAASKSSGLSKAGQALTSFGKSASKYATLPIAGALGFAAKSAIEFESSMANVAKLANLDDKQTKAMGNEILAMSRTMPISASGLASIAASGASLGIATKDLKGFVDVTAKMATSFDMTADQAGNAIAKLRNVYSLDPKGGIKQTEALGDVINALGDNTAARESDIVNSMTRIGGASRNFGFSAQQAAALSAAVISMGNAPEVAATAINSWLPSLQTASKQTPKFQAALKSMGMDAKQLETDIGRNAPEAFQKFVGAIGKLKPAARAAALRDMFGTGSDASILASMANDTTQLAKAFQLAGKAQAGGMNATFAKNSATTANQMQLLKNNVAEVGITLGSAMLPAINGVISALQPLVQGIASFAQANPGITQMAVGFLALVAAVGPVAVAIGSVIAAISTIAPVVMAVGGAIAAAAAAIGAPFILLGVAIAVAAALIIANWSKVSAFFSSLGGKIMSALAPIGSAIQGIFSKFASGFQKGLAPAIPIVMAAVNQIKAAFMGLAPVFSLLGSALSAFFNYGLSSLQAFGAGLAMLFQVWLAQVQAFGAGLAMAFSVIASVIGSIVGVLGAAIGALVATFAMVGAQIAMVFSQIVMTIQMAVMQITMVFAQIGAQIGAAIAGIMATLSSLGAQITAVFASMAAAMTSAMAQVVSAISSGMSQAVSAVTSAGSAMVGAIQGIAGQMFAAGAAIVQQLIAGIQSQIGAAQGAIASLAGSIRGALPFSPAKWGPLSDIDKTGGALVDVFARGIQPGPLMTAVNSALLPVSGALSQPLGTPQVGMGGAMPTGGAGGMGGGTSITYSPTINMGAGGEGQDLKAMLQEHAKELVGLLQNEQRRLERTQYVPGGSVI